MAATDNDFSNNLAQRLRALANDFVGDKEFQAKIEKLSKRDTETGIEATVKEILGKIAATAEEKNLDGIWQQVHAMLQEVAKFDADTAQRLQGIDLNTANDGAKKDAHKRLLEMLRNNHLANSLAQQFAALPKSTQDMFSSMIEPWLKSTGDGAKTILDQAAMQPVGFFGKQLVELLFLLVKVCIGINNPENLKRLEEYLPSSSPEGEKGNKQYIPMPKA